MFDKLKFNNLVISNKKGIQQSRIQTINKLVHKIRKLKMLLEKHPDDTKCKERIRKSTQTMEVLKKFKSMDVMKQILLMDKPASAVITNGTSTPEEIAVAMLSMNKVIQDLVQRFKAELQLNETTRDEWKQVLTESSKRRLKLERTEEKRRKRLELKQQKVKERKREEWLQENQQNMSENNTIGSTTGQWLVEELSNERNANEIDSNMAKGTTKQSEWSEKERTVTSKTFLSNKEQKVANIKKPKGVTHEFKKERKDEDKSDTRENRKIVGDESEKLIGTRENTTEQLVVDPFFITESGENYLSTAVVKTSNTENNAVDFRNINTLYRDTSEKHFTQNRQQRNHKSKGIGEQEPNWNSGRENRGRQQSKAYDNSLQMRQHLKHKKSTNKHENNLHPSWAAKQKLKPVITEYQGKKIIFGDEDSSKSNMHQEKVIKTNRSTIPKQKSTEESLHPSWAAKQKLKASITAFQGKKITFDNDE